jgi:hypothetical protein
MTKENFEALMPLLAVHKRSRMNKNEMAKK